MNVVALVPVLAAIVGLAAGWFLPRYLSPMRATQVLTASIVVTAAAIVAALVQISIAGASEIPAVSDAVGWCRALYHGQHGASPLVGALAAVALGLVTAGVARQGRRVRRDRRAFADVDGLQLIDAEGPVAFAVPGRPGGVVLGNGLLRHLDRHERSAVLAHETAHLTLNHHRYVGAAELCAAGLPFLRPLARRVRFMTERWADEVAADRIGSRQLLARTIARVALMPHGSGPSIGLAFRGHNTISRVEALLDPRPQRWLTSLPLTCLVLGLVVLGSTLQVHHLAEFFAHICPM